MGTLAHFNLAAIAQRYGLRSFVETGTGTGTSLAQACEAPFEALHSIEIVPALAQAARARFAHDKRVTIHEGQSVALLPQIIAALPDGPTLFWLDAHFAGADYGMAGYDADPDLARRLPLAAEVEVIRYFRGGQRDVILIDDARIYQPGPYAAGDLPSDWPPIRGIARSLDFVRGGFGETHGVVVDFADQGYVMVCPRLTHEEMHACPA